MRTKDALHWIAGVFEEIPERVTVDTQRKAIAGWDSLGTLSLIAGLDERFDIQLSERDIEGMQNVNDILELLRGKGALQDVQ